MGLLCFLQERKIIYEFRIPYMAKGVEIVIQQNSHDFGYCQSPACHVKRPHHTKLQDLLFPMMRGAGEGGDEHRTRDMSGLYSGPLPALHPALCCEIAELDHFLFPVPCVSPILSTCFPPHNIDTPSFLGTTTIIKYSEHLEASKD